MQEERRLIYNGYIQQMHILAQFVSFAYELTTIIMEQFVWAGWTVTTEWNQLKWKYNSFYIILLPYPSDASLSLQMQSANAICRTFHQIACYKFLWRSSSNSIRVNAAVLIPTAVSVPALPICPKNNLLRQVFDCIFKTSSHCKEHTGHCCKLSFKRHSIPPLFL